MIFIYLDQSFLSSACFEMAETETSILNKILHLKNNQKARIIISEIHSLETSRIADEYVKKQENLWRFQNDLADGRIAAGVDNIFVAQQRRVLLNDKSLVFPISDIGLEETKLEQRATVQLKNLWLQKIHKEDKIESQLVNESIRWIFERLLVASNNFSSANECLNYIREIWTEYLINAIQNWIDYNNQIIKIKENLDSGVIPKTESLIKPSSLYYLVNELLNADNNKTAIPNWLKLFGDTRNLCSLIKIQSAFEAELIWKLKSNVESLNSRKFHSKFGQSRQFDINHISAYVPYVDILTTDKSMHNLCMGNIVQKELNQYPCKIFSKNNYDDLTIFLDEIIKNG